MTRPRAASPTPKAEACRGCTERDAEIRRLKGALAARAKELETATKGVVRITKAEVLASDRMPLGKFVGHAAHCQCIGCRQGRA